MSADRGGDACRRRRCLRFLVELIAWVAGPWAMGEWLGVWAGGIALVLLVGLPAVLSVPGDKHQVLVPGPGALRFSLELDLGIVAAVAAWFAWPAAAAVMATVVVVLAQLTGWRRSRWLILGVLPFD